MPGRLTVGQMALNHLIHVRIVAGQPFDSHNFIVLTQGYSVITRIEGLERGMVSEVEP